MDKACQSCGQVSVVCTFYDRTSGSPMRCVREMGVLEVAIVRRLMGGGPGPGAGSQV